MPTATDALFDALNEPNANPLAGYEPTEPSPFANDEPADPPVDEVDEEAEMAAKLEAIRQRKAEQAAAKKAAEEQAAAAAAAAAAEAAKPQPVPAPPTPDAGLGGIKRVSFSTTLSLDAYGVRYSSGQVSREYEFSTPVDAGTADEVTEYLAHSVVAHATDVILEKVAQQVKAATHDKLPAQTAGAGYSQLPAGCQQQAAQGAPTGSAADQTRQLLNGQATSAVDGIVQIHVGKDDKGKDEYLYFPHPDRLNRAGFVNAVAEQAQKPVKEGGLGLHPTQIRAFDNREDLMGGKKGFSAGKIVISNEGNADASDAVGKNRAIAWIKFNRLGEVQLQATKDLTSLDAELRVALKQPAL